MSYEKTIVHKAIQEQYNINFRWLQALDLNHHSNAGAINIYKNTMENLLEVLVTVVMESDDTLDGKSDTEIEKIVGDQVNDIIVRGLLDAGLIEEEYEHARIL